MILILIIDSNVLLAKSLTGSHDMKRKLCIYSSCTGDILNALNELWGLSWALAFKYLKNDSLSLHEKPNIQIYNA